MADEEDPWGFAAKRADRLRGTDQEGKAESRPAEVPPDVPERTRGTRARGELRGAMPVTSLRERAWPMALSLALVFVAGFLAEVVAAAQTLTNAGPTALLWVFPLGGLGLIALAVLQFKYVDAKARLPVLRGATLAYAAAMAVAAVLLLLGVVPAFASILSWLMADQMNFLLPLLLWSLAADEFNVAEGRKIFGWIVTWSYVGQVVGLGISTLTAPLFATWNVPLPWLLWVAPVLLVFVGLWLPRKMAGSAAAKGLARAEDLSTSMRSAWDFVSGVPVWRYLLIGSVLVFTAGNMVFIGFLVQTDEIFTGDAAQLQLLYGGVSLVAFALCWLIQAAWAEKLLESWGIPGVLLVLPVAALGAGILLAVGAAGQWLAVLAVALVTWLIPRWSIDENARRAALALVPDERRTRVSFIIDLGPVAVGLILSGPAAAIGVLTGNVVLVGLVAVLLAAASLPLFQKVRRGWEDSLLNWRLRRRKKSRGLDLGE